MSKTIAPVIVLSSDDVTGKPLIDVIKSSVNGAGKYAAYATAHAVTRENVKHHAYALAVLAYPNDKPIQALDGARTRFGNAVQAAAAGLRRTLPKAEVPASSDIPVEAGDNHSETDYLALILEAVEAAINADINASDVLTRVEEYVNSTLV